MGCVSSVGKETRSVSVENRKFLSGLFSPLPEISDVNPVVVTCKNTVTTSVISLSDVQASDSVFNPSLPLSVSVIFCALKVSAVSGNPKLATVLSRTNVTTSLGTCRTVSSSSSFPRASVDKNLTVSLNRISPLVVSCKVPVGKAKMSETKSSGDKMKSSDPGCKDNVKGVKERNVRPVPAEAVKGLGDNGKGFKIPRGIVTPPLRNPSPLEKLEDAYVKGKEFVQSGDSRKKVGIGMQGAVAVSRVGRVVVNAPAARTDVVNPIRVGSTIPSVVPVSRDPLFTFSDISLPPLPQTTCVVTTVLIAPRVTKVASSGISLGSENVKTSEGLSGPVISSAPSRLISETEAEKRKFLTALYAQAQSPFGHLTQTYPIMSSGSLTLFPSGPVASNVGVSLVRDSAGSSVVPKFLATRIVDVGRGSASPVLGVTGLPMGAPPVPPPVARRKVRRSSSENVDSSTSPGRESSDDSEFSRVGPIKKRRLRIPSSPGGNSGGRRSSVDEIPVDPVSVTCPHLPPLRPHRVVEMSHYIVSHCQPPLTLDNVSEQMCRKYPRADPITIRSYVQSVLATMEAMTLLNVKKSSRDEQAAAWPVGAPERLCTRHHLSDSLHERLCSVDCYES